jgi:hypothetical protein
MSKSTSTPAGTRFIYRQYWTSKFEETEQGRSQNCSFVQSKCTDEPHQHSTNELVSSKSLIPPSCSAHRSIILRRATSKKRNKLSLHQVSPHSAISSLFPPRHQLHAAQLSMVIVCYLNISNQCDGTPFDDITSSRAPPPHKVVARVRPKRQRKVRRSLSSIYSFMHQRLPHSHYVSLSLAVNCKSSRTM